MNATQHDIAPSRRAMADGKHGESIWPVLCIALAIIGVMYVYDRAFAQDSPPRQQTDISCHPPSGPVATDAETFSRRS